MIKPAYIVRINACIISYIIVRIKVESFQNLNCGWIVRLFFPVSKNKRFYLNSEFCQILRSDVYAQNEFVVRESRYSSFRSFYASLKVERGRINFTFYSISVHNLTKVGQECRTSLIVEQSLVSVRRDWCENYAFRESAVSLINYCIIVFLMLSRDDLFNGNARWVSRFSLVSINAIRSVWDNSSWKKWQEKVIIKLHEISRVPVNINFIHNAN